MKLLNSIYPNHIKFNKPQDVKFKGQSRDFLSRPSAPDEFTRSVSIEETAPVYQSEKQKNKEKIEQIFNEVYQDVILYNRFLKPLNIQKPEILFCLKSDSSSQFASYNFFLNEFKISDKLCNEDLYLSQTTDEQGNLIACNVLDESTAKNSTPQNPKYKTKLTKLNEKEKELYIKTVIAHELRHCIQEHVLMACTSTKDEYRKICDKHSSMFNSRFLELLSRKIESLKTHAKMGYQEDNKGNDINESIEYYEHKMEKLSKEPYHKTYQIKEGIGENVSFSLPTMIKNKKYLIFEEDLLTGAKNRVDNMANSYEQYLATPNEIDAYAFQQMYLACLIKSSPDIREDVFKGIYTNITTSILIGFEDFQRSGNSFAPI